MAASSFDVCVVGSGPGGGIATYVLAKAGMKVALVEAGGTLTPGKDYNAHLDPFTHLEPRLKAGFKSPFPRLGDFNERDHFTPIGDRPGHGQLRALGGRSLCWAGHSLRFGPIDYKAWPISYDEVAPYYSKAERFMGVSGFKDGLDNLPDGEFLPGVPWRCPEGMLKRGVDKLHARGREMAFVAQRKAIPTARGEFLQPGVRRSLCHFCGHCMAGCEVDSKYTTANTPIPLAQRTGNLTLFLKSMMTRIIMRNGSVEGIDYISGGEQKTIRAKALVLSCSTVETARQLLINKIALSSGQVGRNLTSHFGITVAGFFPEAANRDISNDDGWDYYHSLLTGMYWHNKSTKFEGTYQVQCGAGVMPRSLAVRNVPGFGSSYKKALKELNAGHASMNMQGTVLSSAKKFVDLDDQRKDKFGLPLPRVHLHYEDSDVAMAEDAARTCEEIIVAGGGSVIRTPGTIDASKLAIDYNHWVGTARMGADPKTSVVDRFCRTHDVPNLFIGDASVFPANPEKNPTLTNTALSWRMADHLVELAKKGELA